MLLIRTGRRFWKYGFAFFVVGFLLPYYLLLVSVIQPETKSLFGDESECNQESSSVSFCGCTDGERSFNQSVIAYSLYGGSFANHKYLIKRYFKTLKKNIHEYIPKIYKGKLFIINSHLHLKIFIAFLNIKQIGECDSTSILHRAMILTTSSFKIHFVLTLT